MSTLLPIIGWILIFGIVLLTLGLARWSSILRDTVDQTQFMAAAAKFTRFVNVDYDKIPKPYSLSRVQFAVWTVIISCTYVYLLFIDSTCTFKLIDLNTTALVLMGISAGTLAVAGTIDKGQSDLERHQSEPSGGFLLDILSDENGVSIHRYQNVIWTVIAIFLYIAKINPSLCQLPELDPTLLGLTGISATAYLAVKQGENKK